MIKDFGSMKPPQRQQEKVDLSKRLGKCVKDARLAKGISQEELSERAGYYRTYVGRVENGAIATSVHTVWRLATAMGISLSELVKKL